MGAFDTAHHVPKSVFSSLNSEKAEDHLRGLRPIVDLFDNPTVEDLYVTQGGSEIFNLGPIDNPPVDTNNVFVKAEVVRSSAMPELVGKIIVLEVGPNGNAECRKVLTEES